MDRNMANEAPRYYSLSPPQASSPRYSQPSTPSNFAHHSPLQSRARMNDTTPTRPSPLSRMTLPDTFLGDDFSTDFSADFATDFATDFAADFRPNNDDDVFFSTPPPPVTPLDSFTRSYSDPMANLRRSSMTTHRRHQQQRPMRVAAAANNNPFLSSPSAVRANPAMGRPSALPFTGPSLTMQQYQQAQYQQQQFREQQFRQQQQQPQPLLNLLTCNLCDSGFTLSSESIPPDDEGRAYCAVCVGMISGRIVKEQKALVEAEEADDRADSPDGDDPAAGRHDGDVTMEGSDNLPGAESDAQAVVHDVDGRVADEGLPAEQSQMTPAQNLNL